MNSVKFCAIVLVISSFGVCESGAAEESTPFVYKDNGRRDPFWKLISSSGTVNNYESELVVSDLTLEGIMSGGSGNIAMINGSIVKVNDTISQFVVTEITEDWVLLKKDQQIYKLKIKKEE
ncbi:MAG: hypothetical protein KBD53_06815 [Candidatus Omnitrophica bacterium]|nr:hypothetical protein [Candidatus Omnitrophota bacterium]